MRIPDCYNRPDFPDGWWMRDGNKGQKVRLAWVRNRFTKGCMAWASPQIEKSVPAREGWRCEGCRHLPEGIA